MLWSKEKNKESLLRKLLKLLHKRRLMPTLLHIDMWEQQEKEEKNYKNKTSVITPQMNTGLLICHLVSLEDIFSYKMMSMKTLKIQRKKLKMKNQLKNHLIQMMNELIKILFFKVVNKKSLIIFIGNEFLIIDDTIIIFKYLF